MKTSLCKKITASIAILLMTAILAFATPTAITPQTLKMNNYAVQAGDLTITFTAADAVNGNSYLATGTEVVIANNTDSSSHTITVTSVADVLGRTDSSLTSYSVAANTIAAIEMKSLTGWLQSGGTVLISSNSNLVKFAVVRFQ